MSLINEALRKARQAASEREAKQPEGAFQPARAYPSRRSGRGGGPFALALIAIVAGVAGASAAWWFLGDRQTPSTRTSVVEAPTSNDALPEAQTGVSPTPSLLQSEAGSAEAAADQASTAEIARPVDPGSEGRADAEPDRVDSSPGKIATAKIVGASGERVFVMEAELGYASLSLGFIVARSTNPFAEINGIDVYVGAEIEGFVVEAIEADRVVLRDHKGTLILRVP